MALNKAQTSTISKVIIGFFGFALVAAVGAPSIANLTGIGGGGQDEGAKGVLDGFAEKYQPTVDAYNQLLASDPASSTVLVNLGNLYFDWAGEIQQASAAVPQGTDIPLWAIAAQTYERAVAAGAQTSQVRTDMAVAYFYSGDTGSAIEVIEGVISEQPDFATAQFNAGIFYQDAGRKEDALRAFGTYLELDPTGQSGNADYARSQLQTLSGSGTATGTADGTQTTTP